MTGLSRHDDGGRPNVGRKRRMCLMEERVMDREEKVGRSGGGKLREMAACRGRKRLAKKV